MCHKFSRNSIRLFIEKKKKKILAAQIDWHLGKRARVYACKHLLQYACNWEIFNTFDKFFEIIR